MTFVNLAKAIVLNVHVKKVDHTVVAAILVKNLVKNLERVVVSVHLEKVEAKVHVIAQENVD